MRPATNDPTDLRDARGLRLLWCYGDWRNRVASRIVSAVPSERDPAVAFVLSADALKRWWHRVDLSTGAVLERRDLGLRSAVPIDVLDDGKRVLVLGEGSLRLRTRDGEHIWKRGGGWQQVAVAASRGVAVASSSHGALGEIDLATGALVRSLPGFAPFSIARDGRWLMHVAKHKRLELRDLDSGEVVARWTPSEGETLWNVLALPGGAGGVCAFCTREGLFVERLAPGAAQPLWRTPVVAQTAVPVLALTPDGDGVLVQAGALWLELRLDDGARRAEHRVGAHQGARFSADGTRAVLFNASVYWLWNVVARRATRSDVGHAGVVGALEFAHGGRTLASLAADGTVAVHRCDRDEVVWTLETPDRAWGMTLRFSADNRTLLASGPTATRRAAWDLDTGMPVPFPIALHEKAAAWALSPDETLLWWRVDGWGPEGGAQLVRRADGVVLWSSSGWGCSAAFGDDGAVVAVAEGGDMLAVFYWLRAREGFRPERVATPRKQGSWQGENPSELCLFCDDGTRSVAKAMGAEVVCDTRTGELLGTTPAWCVRHAFRSPDCLVGVENDGTVWVWEVPSFRVRARLSLRDLDDAPSAVAISSDGGLLAVGTEAGVLFLFAVEG